MARGTSKSHRRRMAPRATWAALAEDRAGGRRLKARKRLPPGAPGTKRLTAVYGDRLVFVHYSKTLELHLTDRIADWGDIEQWKTGIVRYWKSDHA